MKTQQTMIPTAYWMNGVNYHPIHSAVSLGPIRFRRKNNFFITNCQDSKSSPKISKEICTNSAEYYTPRISCS